MGDAPMKVLDFDEALAVVLGHAAEVEACGGTEWRLAGAGGGCWRRR